MWLLMLVSSLASMTVLFVTSIYGCKSGQYDRAFRYFHLWMQHGLQMRNTNHNIDNGDNSGANGVPKVVPFKPKVATYKILMKEMDEALQLFDEIPERNVVSGNYMVDDYEMCGDVAMGNAYSPVQDVADSCSTGTTTNVICVLAACAILGALEIDKWVHFYITRNKLALTVNLGATLMILYAKCGLLDNSLEVFEQMPQKNVLSLTALILGLASNGRGREALDMFHQMQEF
ncbi:pentatricopeptide repeat-containing protein At3g47530-like [Aristolochia californica]|uniref:pentatricopeptide repeat-containing protein At3g47530-like n=1 Tax=Aristolochia californica TaxID=171875 RepID=UPI0035DE4722